MISNVLPDIVLKNNRLVRYKPAKKKQKQTAVITYPTLQLLQPLLLSKQILLSLIDRQKSSTPGNLDRGMPILFLEESNTFKDTVIKHRREKSVRNWPLTEMILISGH